MHRMTTTMAVGAILLAAGATLHAQQDGVWVETNFNRVHLRNGAYIDGHLLSETPHSIAMNIVSGEMNIRKDMIERDDRGRLRIEMIKMRSYKELPKLADVILPPAPSKETTSTPIASSPAEAAEKVELSGTVAEQIVQVRQILGQANSVRKAMALQTLS